MFVTFLILFNTFVPLSLYVTLEMVKVRAATGRPRP
jgi:magnesium-transporting ATPase (P-type)